MPSPAFETQNELSQLQKQTLHSKPDAGATETPTRANKPDTSESQNAATDNLLGVGVVFHS